jgi:hypothetical protein
MPPRRLSPRGLFFCACRTHPLRSLRPPPPCAARTRSAPCAHRPPAPPVPAPLLAPAAPLRCPYPPRRRPEGRAAPPAAVSPRRGICFFLRPPPAPAPLLASAACRRGVCRLYARPAACRRGVCFFAPVARTRSAPCARRPPCAERTHAPPPTRGEGSPPPRCPHLRSRHRPAGRADPPAPPPRKDHS